MLNRLARRTADGSSPCRMGRFVHTVKALLAAGARLYYRDPEETMSSIGALTQFANTYPEDFPFSEFAPYLRCPLEDKHAKLDVNLRQPAPLLCLAARRVPKRRNELDLPRMLRDYVEGHQDLGSKRRRLDLR